MANEDASKTLEQLEAAFVKATLDLESFKQSAVTSVRLELTEIASISPKSKPKFSFLEVFPREIRDHIYRYALTNPILGTREAVQLDANPKYELSPELLRTCRQVLKEGSEILYGENTFFVEILHHHYCVVNGLTSPLNRHFDREHAWKGHDCITSGALEPNVVKQVKHWKIIENSFNANKGQAYFLSSHPLLIALCRTLVDHPPRSLTVLLIPQSVLDNYKKRALRHGIEFSINPFLILRNVGSFKLTYASLEDIPLKYFDGLELDPEQIPELTETDENLANYELSTKALVESSTPVEYTFKMHQNLVAYCQALERNPVLRKDMHKLIGQTWYCRCTRKEWQVDDINFYNFENTLPENPYNYQLTITHPVEDALELAAIASEINQVEEFKLQRKTILETLEPQYQRIVNASLAVTEFIKDHKVPGRMFDPDRAMHFGDSGPVDGSLHSEKVYLSDYALGYTLLEEYVRAFDRDVPFRIKHLIKALGRKFSLTYKKLPCEQLLKQIEVILEEGKTLPQLIPKFRLLINELETQYLAIRDARRVLFDHDLTDRGCDIDCELWRCDGEIDWSVCEPLFGAPNQERELPRSSDGKSRSWGDYALWPRDDKSEPWKWGNGDTYLTSDDIYW